MRPSGQSARYSRLEGADDSLRIKVKTLDNDSTWEVDGEGSWTVRQLKDHVRSRLPRPPSALLSDPLLCSAAILLRPARRDRCCACDLTGPALRW